MLQTMLRMLEEGRFQECVDQGEQLLLEGGRTTGEIATINMAIARARLGMNDILGAIPAGRQAMELAEEAGEWDVLGRVLLNMGTAHIGLRDYKQAIQVLRRYFDFLDRYEFSKRFEGAVWKHLGVAYQNRLESAKAIEAFEKAIAWFAERDIQMSVFSCRHDLINTQLQLYDTWKIHDIVPIQDLIRQQYPLVKMFKGDTYYSATYLLDRAACNMYQHKFERAYVSARRAIRLRPNDPWTCFHANLSMARTCLRATEPRKALAHAMTARSHAAKMKHFELEFIAVKMMTDVLRAQDAQTIQTLDREYKEQGVDLGQYVSPILLQRYVN